jgi:hypothetical protein
MIRLPLNICLLPQDIIFHGPGKFLCSTQAVCCAGRMWRNVFSMLSKTFQTLRLIIDLVIDLFCKVVTRAKLLFIYALCLKVLHLPYEASYHNIAPILCGHVYCNRQNRFVFIILGQRIVQWMMIEMKYLQLLVTFLT